MNDKQSGEVTKAASAMGAATFLSRILGLVREQVFAIFFGAGFATDAFQIAFRIPNLLRDLFAEGAMSAALVPTFVEFREKQGVRESWRLAGLVFRSLFITMMIVALVGSVFSDSLVDLYAGSYQEIDGKYELTVLLTRILYFYFPFVTLAAAFMSVLNASGIYFIPALAPAIFNLTSIIFGVALSFVTPNYGYHPIVGMAIGVVLGGIVQAFFQLPKLYRAGYMFPKKEPLDSPWSSHPGLKKMILLMIPGTMGLAATQVNILINSILATSQEQGAVSWLNYAFRLMQFPIGVFGVSLAMATLPRVSQAWSRGQPSEFTSTLTQSLRKVMAINIPASVGLFVLGNEIVQLIFEYGRFDRSDTIATAAALSAYALGLAFYSAVKVMAPAFYAIDRARIAVSCSVISVIANVLLSLILIRVMGYVGLALSTSVTAIINFLLLVLLMNRFLAKWDNSISWGSVFKSILGYLGVSILMGLVCYWSIALWPAHWLNALLADQSNIILVISRAIRAIMLVIIGAGVALGCSHVLGLRELGEFVAPMLRKSIKILQRGKNKS